MQIHTIILLIVIGLAAGMLSGLVGVGGGIIIVPSLVLLLGFTQKEAQGTSLAILLLPIGIFAVYEYYRQGEIKVNAAIVVSIAFLLGSYLGSRLSLSLNEHTLKRIFAIILLLLSIRMLFFEGSKQTLPGQTNNTAKSSRSDHL